MHLLALGINFLPHSINLILIILLLTLLIRIIYIHLSHDHHCHYYSYSGLLNGFLFSFPLAF